MHVAAATWWPGIGSLPWWQTTDACTSCVWPCWHQRGGCWQRKRFSGVNDDGRLTVLAQINSSAFGDGWMMKIKASDPSELDSLMDATAYEKTTDEAH